MSAVPTYHPMVSKICLMLHLNQHLYIIEMETYVQVTRNEAGKLGAVVSNLIRDKKRQEARTAYNAQPNKCLTCDDPIYLPDDRRLHDIKKRKFCSQSCGAQYNNTKRSIKRNCLFCSKPLTWPSKKYCNHTCSSQARSQQAVAKAMAGSGPTIAALRRFLFRRNPQCWNCGWKEINPVTGKTPLVLNHIDGDSRNNRESNLELLCPNCDSLTPTYKALNKGKGRFKRMQRYLEGKSY